MIGRYPRFRVLVTHLPTGAKAEIDSFNAKDVREAHRKALNLLRSRVAAARSGLRPSSSVVASYVLPDGLSAPDDLGLYRKP